MVCAVLASSCTAPLQHSLLLHCSHCLSVSDPYNWLAFCAPQGAFKALSAQSRCRACIVLLPFVYVTSVAHPLWWLQQAEQEFRAKVEAALEANEVDEDQLIEERRRRRQEILAKHGQAQGQHQAPQPGVHPSALHGRLLSWPVPPKNCTAQDLIYSPGSCLGESRVVG